MMIGGGNDDVLFLSHNTSGKVPFHHYLAC